MAAPYPPIEPYEHGMLDTGDGNRIYWETCGNPHGKPAVVVHGGPGTGTSTGPRKSFNPERYRIILFDQRNCGRSTPHASDPAADMSLNTTEHLLSDMELLREHLGVEKWLMFGGSWGSTLVLAYAERHPERVSEIIMPALTTTRHDAIDWLYHGVRRFFPGEWEAFRDAVPEADRGGKLTEAYARLMESPDRAVREAAARAWMTWEDTVLSLEPNNKRSLVESPVDWMVAFVRICAHFYANYAWLEDGELVRGAHRLAGIPGVIIHGRLDLSCPYEMAWELAKAWPDCELIPIADAGHHGSEAMNTALYAAIERFSSR